MYIVQQQMRFSQFLLFSAMLFLTDLFFTCGFYAKENERSVSWFKCFYGMAVTMFGVNLLHLLVTAQSSRL